GEQVVHVKPGATNVSFPTQADQSGFVTLRATVSASSDTLADNNALSSVVQVQGPPRVMVVEGRSGEAAAIVGALSSGGMEVETHPPSDVPTQPEGLGAYAAVVLADVAAPQLDDAQQTTLRSFVR